MEQGSLLLLFGLVSQHSTLIPAICMAERSRHKHMIREKKQRQRRKEPGYRSHRQSCHRLHWVVRNTVVCQVRGAVKLTEIADSLPQHKGSLKHAKYSCSSHRLYNFTGNNVHHKTSPSQHVSRLSDVH